METKGYIIRKAVFDDLNAVHQLINELEDRIFDLEKFKLVYFKNCTHADFHYYVAEAKSKVVGFISINFQYPLHHCNRIAEIQELIVNKEHRNLKIGSALIDGAKKIAQENNCDTLELTSRFKRLDAHRFYEREGFQKTHFKFLMKFT